MWKDEYNKFTGLTKKIYEEYRYGLGLYGYWIYEEDPDEDGMGILEILYLDSDDGCIIFSSENEIFPENGMQIKLIGCQYTDISTKTLREITGIMSKFMTARRKRYSAWLTERQKSTL
jgi:hypothetical protein